MLKTICFKWMNYMLSELYLNKLSCFKVIDFITAFSGIFAFADTCPQLLPIPFKVSKYGSTEGIFLLAPNMQLYFIFCTVLKLPNQV